MVTCKDSVALGPGARPYNEGNLAMIFSKSSVSVTTIQIFIIKSNFVTLT